MEIEIEDPALADVTALLAEHLSDMHSRSPAESVHALDVRALRVPGLTFWTVRRDGLLLGCGAIKELDATHGELKSMRTTTASRRTGVGRAMLVHLIGTARERGYSRLSLETGTQDYFLPARTLYAAHGFVACGPFADYTEDPFSTYFTLSL
jgi:putative acetyltransferase